jgi:hypothetical protein
MRVPRHISKGTGIPCTSCRHALPRGRPVMLPFDMAAPRFVLRATAAGYHHFLRLPFEIPLVL